MACARAGGVHLVRRHLLWVVAVLLLWATGVRADGFYCCVCTYSDGVGENCGSACSPLPDSEACDAFCASLEAGCVQHRDTSCAGSGFPRVCDLENPGQCKCVGSPPGDPCTLPTQCASGFCVSGVCCASACPAPGQCALPGQAGTCVTPSPVLGRGALVLMVGVLGLVGALPLVRRRR